jgi:hypothetical protein
MKAHPHPNLGVRRPSESGQSELSAYGGLDGAAGAIERDEEPIASGVDLVAAVRRERFSHKPAVIASDSREDTVSDASHKLR